MSARRDAYLVMGVVLLALVAAIGTGCGSGGSSGGAGNAAALEGTSWRLTGWSETSQDPNDFVITAEFKDGRVGGKSAVNQYGGPYTAGDDGSIAVGELVSTMMAGPEPAMQAEKTYLDLLAATTTYNLDEDTLTLTADSGQKLVYSRVASSPSP